MNMGELTDLLIKDAKGYVEDAPHTLKRNSHMNELNGAEVAPEVIEAVVVGFINFVAAERWMDLGLCTRDLKDKP